MENMQQFQSTFLDIALESQALTFGSFTLKSGRQSPYFFNAGLLNTGKQMSVLAVSYAQAIIDAGFKFDVLFGPAYKGIPLAAVTVAKLAELDPENYSDVTYAFDRKEKKDHGEGGSIVGDTLAGKRVLIIDDAISAGTAINEAFAIVAAEQGTVVATIIALDRQETTADSTKSATQCVSDKYGIPVLSIVTLDDIVHHFLDKLSPEKMEAIAEYRKKYSPC